MLRHKECMRYEKSYMLHNLLLQLLVAAFVFIGLIMMDRISHSEVDNGGQNTGSHVSISK